MLDKPIPKWYFANVGVLSIMIVVAYFVINLIMKISFIYGILFIISSIGLVIIPNLFFYYKLTRDEQLKSNEVDKK